MNRSEVLTSIGDKVAAIDLKLEGLLKNGNQDAAAQLKEMKAFFEELARIVDVKFIGDLPQAIENLEKCIKCFDLDLGDSLKTLADHLLSFETQLEEKICDEIEALGTRLEKRLDRHQESHARRLDRLAQSIESLSSAISELYDCRPQEDDSVQLNDTLNQLNRYLEQHMQEKNTKGGFWRRKK